MRHVVVGVVAFVAVLVLSLGPVVTAPVAGALLVLCTVVAGALRATNSGVGDEPGPLGP